MRALFALLAAELSRWVLSDSAGEGAGLLPQPRQALVSWQSGEEAGGRPGGRQSGVGGGKGGGQARGCQWQSAVPRIDLWHRVQRATPNHSHSSPPLNPNPCCSPPLPLLLQLAVQLRGMPHESAAASLQLAAVNLAQRVA